ncbi:Ankyrin repeat-containing protein [Paenibacillus sp. UNC499MF]|nr:Ankyrin repeat-containing protein [Paenibacillus sp. UNC499MF]
MRSEKDVVQLLLKGGADPNLAANDHATALIYTASSKSNEGTEVLRMLLDAGANPNVLTDYGRTPLLAAASGDHVDRVKLLIEKGADPYQKLNTHPLTDAATKEKLKNIIAGLQPSKDSGTSTPKGNTNTENKGKGNLKGTITWRYNEYIGTKPDIDARVYLIPVNFDKNSITEEQSRRFTFGYTPDNNTSLYYKSANGYGNFEINSIDAGDYYAVISSSKTKRRSLEPLSEYVVSTLKPLLRDWDDFSKFFLQMNKHEVKRITIKPNETLNISHDFGYTYY